MFLLFLRNALTDCVEIWYMQLLNYSGHFGSFIVIFRQTDKQMFLLFLIYSFTDCFETWNEDTGMSIAIFGQKYKRGLCH